MRLEFNLGLLGMQACSRPPCTRQCQQLLMSLPLVRSERAGVCTGYPAQFQPSHSYSARAALATMWACCDTGSVTACAADALSSSFGVLAQGKT